MMMGRGGDLSFLLQEGALMELIDLLLEESSRRLHWESV